MGNIPISDQYQCRLDCRTLLKPIYVVVLKSDLLKKILIFLLICCIVVIEEPKQVDINEKLNQVIDDVASAESVSFKVVFLQLDNDPLSESVTECKCLKLPRTRFIIIFVAFFSI